MFPLYFLFSLSFPFAWLGWKRVGIQWVGTHGTPVYLQEVCHDNIASWRRETLENQSIDCMPWYQTYENGNQRSTGASVANAVYIVWYSKLYIPFLLEMCNRISTWCFFGLSVLVVVVVFLHRFGALAGLRWVAWLIYRRSLCRASASAR